MSALRVVSYLNQFFGQIGGEGERDPHLDALGHMFLEAEARSDDILNRLGPWAIVAFIVAYILDAIVLGPAWLFALAAGLAFGLVRGGLIVWFSATIAAGAAFLIARYLARHRVEQLAKKNEKFEAVDRAIAKSGWKVALMLRISPLFPYTIANYLYGLTAIRFWPYMFATAVGIVPMVSVYVSIGAAGREAALASAGGHQSKTEWIVLGVGLLLTIAAGILIARGAQTREVLLQRTMILVGGIVLDRFGNGDPARGDEAREIVDMAIGVIVDKPLTQPQHAVEAKIAPQDIDQLRRLIRLEDIVSGVAATAGPGHPPRGKRRR